MRERMNGINSFICYEVEVSSVFMALFLGTAEAMKWVFR